MKITALILITSLFSAFSCSTRKDMAFNQRPNEHKRLYTYPDKIDAVETDQRYRQVVVASINDFKGKIEPNYFVKLDKRFNNKTTLASGGVAAIKTYSDILRQFYQHNFLFVDTGNFLAPNSDHKLISFYRNYLNFDVVSLAPQDFTLTDINHSKLKYLVAESRSKVVASNIYSLQDTAPVNWQGLNTQHIQMVNGIKVGFLGIVSPKTVLSLDKKHFTGLYFQNPTQVIMQQASQLRRDGAQVVVVLFNSGLDCTSLLAQEEKLPIQKVNFNPQEIAFCDFYENELADTLKRLPPHAVDLVITGGKESKVVNFINGHPVMQNFGGGQYINWVEIYFDTKLGVVDPTKTRLFQPVELCHNFILKTEDCYTGDSISDMDLGSASFLGKRVEIAPLPQFKN